MSIFSVFFLLSLTVFPTFNCNQVQAPIPTVTDGCTGNNTSTGDGSELVPLIDHKKQEMMMMMMVMNETRRNMGSFQVCAPCTCCNGTLCLPYPCCYAINCNIPGKPFGFCSFTPRTCDCFGCHA